MERLLTRSEYDRGPTGLGGWLILVAVALTASSIVGVINVLQSAPLAFHPELLSPLMDKVADTEPVRRLLYFECAGSVLLLILLAISLVLFFRKSQRFPLFTMAVLVLIAIYAILDEVLSSHIPELGGGSTTSLGVQLCNVFILIWYLLRSRRVANTFCSPVS